MHKNEVILVIYCRGGRNMLAMRATLKKFCFWHFFKKEQKKRFKN